MTPIPPTVVVVHRRENRKKCTVQPLRSRPDFRFLNYPFAEPPKLDGYVRLDLAGPLLGAADRGHGLLILDATWRLAERMAGAFADVPVRSLPAWRTALPRASKIFVDPPTGLATVEAIYLAYSVLGRDTTGLLDEYRWAEEFLRLNGAEPDRAVT